MIAAIKQCLIKEAHAILKFSEEIDNDLIPFLDKLSQCKGKRCFIGVGKSLIVAEKIASSFSSIGYPAIEIDPLRLLHGDLGFLTKDDLVIAISNSGETEILVNALNFIHDKGIDIVSITGNDKSSIAQISSVHAVVKTKEDGAFGVIPSTSTTTVLAFGDALLCGLIVRDKISLETFLNSHPGGELGKLLIL